MVTGSAGAGRPRSEEARTAVLQAVDDLVREIGYGALSMKGIAERAGVGRQTVYRWWSTKAEVLFEAVITDAAQELRPEPAGSTVDDVHAYLVRVSQFLTGSDAGAGYRALIGEAQHDRDVQALMSSVDIFASAADAIVDRAIDRGDLDPSLVRPAAVAVLTGPCYYLALDRGSVAGLDLPALARSTVQALRALSVVEP